MKLLLDGDLDTFPHYWIDAQGYARISDVSRKEITVHRYVIENQLKRKLVSPECVHHINGNKLDNRLCNLMLCKNQAAHHMEHIKQHALDNGADLTKVAWCSYHKCYEDISEFSTSPQHWNGLHNQCKKATNEYRKLHGLNKNKFNWRERLNQQYRRASKKNTNISWVGQEGRCL